ncbi:hypothetical protein [Yersinia phage fHe-Yen9-03]|uniref:Uncharacterized protein n=1 Tax=Yersinia phage fHe-Yen9-03 TaxID=2052743 RepID=A0A2C9CZY5_9CAUD|nr:hypothetical protein [Yersinia phage fHe-Yen9-03]
MIKLLMDVPLSALSTEQLKLLDWKSLNRTDIESVDDEFISANFNKFSTNLVKHLIINGRVTPNVMQHDQWIEFINTQHEINVFKYIQFPYSIINELLENNKSTQFQRKIIDTQHSVPIETIINNISPSSLNDMLLSNSNPAVIDYIQTPEGSELLKKRGTGMMNNLNFLTSTEANNMGFVIKNHTISVEVLRRAGACSDGCNYARRILKELNVSHIKWDDAILLIRNSPKLQNRTSIRNYLSWIIESRSRVVRASSELF